MIARSTFGLALAVLAVCAVLLACGGPGGTPPSAPSPTPMGPRVDRCGFGLVAEDPHRGLPSATLDPGAGELFVDALLFEDASGAWIEGRTLAYAGRLRGDVPGLHTGTGRLLLEAQHEGSGATASPPPSGDVDCDGAIRIALTNDVLTGPGAMGRALVSATLAGADVRGGIWHEDCFASHRQDESTAIECSLVGVRRGATATAGILRLRLAWAGMPIEVASLPGWAAELIGAAATPGPIGTRAPMTWTVSADRPSLVENRGGPGGEVVIRPDEGTIRYRLQLPVVHRPDLADPRQREGMLSVAISGYSGPGDYRADAITGELRLRGDGSWAEPGDRLYELAACSATLASDGEGRLECTIGGVPGGMQAGEQGHLSATWRVDVVPTNVGRQVEVAWKLGDHYRSEGRTTVTSAGTQRPGRYDVPEVRVGGRPAAPEVLRISIMPFMGDGTYTGEAITAMLDGVTGQSPQVVVDGQRRSEAWSPLFGDCVVTIEDSGGTGKIECPGEPAGAQFQGGGSTTLSATWRVLS